MAIRVSLRHKTTYRYEKPASLGPQTIRLRPAPHNRTPINRYSLKILPEDHFINWQQDAFGNYLARVVVPEKTRIFEVEVDLVADLEAYSPFDYFLEESAEKYPFSYEDDLLSDLEPYLVCLPATPRFDAFMETIDRTRRDTNHFLVETNQAITAAVDYVIRMEPGVQTPEETLEIGSGSCRDSSWLLVQVLRRLGIAARFVSGYLVQLKADQEPVDAPPGPEADFTDLHAWCECYVPGAGWIGLDPTSGLLAAEGHIPLAATPSPSSAAAISGAVEDVEADFDFEMEVSRVIDRARVTKPYSEEDWSSILELGDEVDRHLDGDDVRLSMGGEPTFVSIEEPDEPEWNTDALGGRKEEIADRLMRRLKDLWATGGVLHHGQGKWYPGEQLPRWAQSCYFRADGQPVWREEKWIADAGRDYGHTTEDAERFGLLLAEKLDLDNFRLFEGYEDAWYYLWREKRLPTNVDPLRSNLEDPLERERLTRVFEQGLNQAVGWILPLAHEGVWQSGDWFLRGEHCFLIPGDSAMGYRLPLDSLPWSARGDRPVEFSRDPFEPKDVLPAQFEQRPRHAASVRLVQQTAQSLRLRPAGSDSDSGSDSGEEGSALGIVRSALCVEPRGGHLKVFLPPIYALEPWLELIAAIEATASELSLPVQLEGYPPPRDQRLLEFKVTPDPGVIEVNVPPTRGWRNVVRQSEELYEAARHEKLAAEKFEVDGAHIGSGGGNHVVLGGLTPTDSPFLRRPDVLGSLLRFWHNHPSLSYLFSGRFIGPTSQAPRVDEARNDAAYELELALAQLPSPGTDAPPWHVDRTLRNILVDLTGNTHRSEFCIDKLYSPDGPTGRLGLLELRAFEMPPHERMAAVQQLLVRSLIAKFWAEPNTNPLIKWRTSLHDQFMMHHWVDNNFDDVLRELDRAGFPMNRRWFEPHFEFRFPYFGEVTLDAMRFELRGALEPWHVLGEEASGTGQARYVDSSVERVEIKAYGLEEERYSILCNGFEMPLQPTETNGEFVAGVRFRAWQPAFCLHPQIGIHSPLRFDLYDRWNRTALAGCTYHVVHPGGRASEVRPVNAAAAESRRLARFERHGHTAGLFDPSPFKAHPHFPHLLDLLRANAGRKS